VRVPETAPAASRNLDGLAGHHEIGEELACPVFVDRGAWRHVEEQVIAGGAVPPCPLAAAAARRPEMVLEAEVAKGRLSGIDAKDH
jgi:hypothetical protein